MIYHGILKGTEGAGTWHHNGAEPHYKCWKHAFKTQRSSAKTVWHNACGL